MDDLKPLIVSVEANLNKLNKQMAQAAKIGSDAAKAIDKDFTSANDNIAKSYDKSAKAGTASLGQQQAAAQNLHFQIHQIATTLAGGMSPFEVMAQQGFQVVDALEQAGKGTAIFTAIGGAVTKILNPLSLLTFGTIYLTGVAVDYFMKMAGGADAAIKAIDEQISHIDRMAKAYANSIPELKAIDDQLQAIKQHIQDTQDAAANKATQVGNVQGALTDLKRAVAETAGAGFGNLPAATVDKLKAIKNQLDDLEHAAATGTLKAQDLVDVFSRLDEIMAGIKNKDALGDLPAQLEKTKTKLEEVTKTAHDVITATQKAADPDAQAVEKFTKAMKDMGAVTAATMTKAEEIEKHYKEAIAAATEEVNRQTGALHERAAEIERNNQLTQLHNDAIQQLGGAAIGGDQSDIERIIGQIESGNRDLGYRPGGGPGMKDTISGRYQFSQGQYLEEMRKLPEYADPKVVSDATLIAQKNVPAIQKAAMDQALKDYGTILTGIGKDASDATNIYLLHLFGKQGGKDLLQAAPGASAAGIVGAGAIAGNKWVTAQGGTAQDVINAVRARVKQADIQSGGGAHDFPATIANIEKETKAIEEENKAAGFLTDSYDKVTYAKEKAAKVTELTDAAQKQGLVVTDAEKKQIDAVADAYAKAAGQKALYAKATADSKKQEQLNIDAQKQHAQALAQLRDQLANLGASFVEGFISDMKNGVKATDALRNALSRLADSLLNMALNTLFKNVLNVMMPGAASIGGASGIMSGIPGFQMHGGGVVGAGGMRRNVSALAFAGAPRMHGGGLAGDEVAAILQRGETVLPRGYRAGGGGSTSISNNVGNISIDMSGTGQVAADTDSGKRFGENVRKLIQREMVAQSRPGGLLTTPGSGGRVGR
jgi:uncharacterized protein YciW